MMSNRDLSREDLEKLTPKEYLQRGYCDASGQPLPELASTYATAACVQLERARISPQELGGTLEALRQVLPWHWEEDPNERMRNAVDEAVELASAMYQQPSNEGLLAWLDQCVEAVYSAPDAEAFVAHFTSVLRQYSAIMALRSRP